MSTIPWIRWTEDGGIWLRDAPGSLQGMDGLLVKGSVTLHPGDIDFPFWEQYLRGDGILPPGEKGGES